MEAGGIKKAQEPIMIGKATCGDIPSENTNAMHGAYKRKVSDCCVYCSYITNACPPIQEGGKPNCCA